jgi:hypothetical protein
MRFLFYLNGQQLVVYLADSDGVERLVEFPDNESGRNQFSEFLTEQANVPCRLLVDLIEEEFREETLPHVTGKDKTILHSRHAARIFRTTPFRHSQVIFREKSGRRDDHVLFSSLTNKDIIEPWLEIINQHKMPLVGIHSLTVITCRLAELIGAKSDNILIITQQRGNNLRETFVKNGRVRFSRLAPLLESDCSTYGVVVSAEVDKTKRYLNTLKLLEFNDQLEVVVISDTDHLDTARQACITNEQLAYSFHAIQDVASKLKIQDYPDGQFSDSLFVSLLTNKHSKNHYAQPEHLYLGRTYYAAHAIKVLSGTLAAGALLWCGINITDTLLLKQETKTILSSIDQVQNNLRQLTGATNNPSVNPEDILAAVKLSDALNNRRDNPQYLLAAVGAAMQNNPNLVLDKLVWSTQQPAKPANEMNQNDTPEHKGTINTLIKSTLIAEGHIDDFNGSYLQANNEIKQFSQHLAEQPNIISAHIIKLPVNTASTTDLVGKLHVNEEPGKAEFTVRIVMESPHGQS